MQLYSGNTYIIDRKLNNPADTGTYFVQAVIKNSLTGATLATLNLTDNGNKYFSKSWLVPGDPTGQGLQISVFATAYTDAGYTTESLIYGTELDNYMIENPPARLGGAGGASGGFFDYEGLTGLIEKMVKKQLDILLAAIRSEGKSENIDYERVQQGIEAYNGELGIRIGERISKIEDAFGLFMESLKGKLAEINVPDVKAIEENITAATSRLEEIATNVNDLKDNIDGSVGVHSVVSRQIAQAAEGLKQEISSLRKDTQIKNETFDLVSKMKSLIGGAPEIESKKPEAPKPRPLTGLIP